MNRWVNHVYAMILDAGRIAFMEEQNFSLAKLEFFHNCMSVLGNFCTTCKTAEVSPSLGAL